MEINLKIKVKPFKVPNFVLADKTTSDPHGDTKFALSDLDIYTLENLCEQFRREVFEKADKQPPPRIYNRSD